MFNLLLKNIFKNNLSWCINFKNPIWKFYPEHRNILICETRDLNNKTAYFHAINYIDGKILWKDFLLKERWWIGVENIIDDVILFHEYLRPDFPIHQKIIAVSIKNQNILWSNSELQFVKFYQNKIIATTTDIEKSTYFQLDINTGKIIREFSVDEFKELNNDFNKVEGYLEPYQVNIDEISQEVVKKYINKRKFNPCGESDFLPIEQKNIYLLGISIRNKNSKINDLIICLDFKGRKIFSVIINKDVNQTYSHRFVVKESMIYFIKNKNNLCAIKLW